MNLQGSITELQDTIAKLYVELEQRFKENLLIRDLWNSMAHDIMQQKRSMAAIPHSFWNQLKEQQETFSNEISRIRHQTFESKEDITFIHSFGKALLYEEPTILKVYVPIIRKLRENWTDQALDFYIMVKAHLARITRVTQSFAGDPGVLQRSSLLLQRFEKEVQEPRLEPKHNLHKVESKEKHAPKHQKKAAPKQTPALAKHAKAHHTRAKPLVEKMTLPRRHARR